jgi:acyl-CoA synthetase (NDP forming)
VCGGDNLDRRSVSAMTRPSRKPTIGRRLITSLDRIGFAGQGLSGQSELFNRAPSPMLAERGVRAAVIYDGGFAEQGENGRRLQAQIAAICRRARIALCGPNCMGVLNPDYSSTTYLQELRDPPGLAGDVGIVSQSGAFCVTLMTDIRRFGFSHVVSSGNEVVLAAADYLEYLADDAYTKIIGAFIETVRQPERFAAALDRAKEAGKPVVVLKVGRASLISFSSSDPGFRS